MNYSPSSCTQLRFTEGQATRMQVMWETYRHIPVVDASVVTARSWRLYTTREATMNTNGWFFLKTLELYSQADCNIDSKIDTSKATVDAFKSLSIGGVTLGPENVLDASTVDTYWGTSGSTMWIELTFPELVTVKCVSLDQSEVALSDFGPTTHVSSIIVQNQPPGKAYWNPVVECKGLVSGVNTCRNLFDAGTTVPTAPMPTVAPAPIALPPSFPATVRPITSSPTARILTNPLTPAPILTATSPTTPVPTVLPTQGPTVRETQRPTPGPTLTATATHQASSVCGKKGQPCGMNSPCCGNLGCSKSKNKTCDKCRLANRRCRKAAKCCSNMCDRKRGAKSGRCK
jgi:hypothetical protein